MPTRTAAQKRKARVARQLKLIFSPPLDEDVVKMVLEKTEYDTNKSIPILLDMSISQGKQIQIPDSIDPKIVSLLSSHLSSHLSSSSSPPVSSSSPSPLSDPSSSPSPLSPSPQSPFSLSSPSSFSPPSSLSPSSLSPSPLRSSSGEWTCIYCETENSQRGQCILCGISPSPLRLSTEASSSSPEKKEEEKEEEEEEEEEESEEERKEVSGGKGAQLSDKCHFLRSLFLSYSLETIRDLLIECKGDVNEVVTWLLKFEPVEATKEKKQKEKEGGGENKDYFREMAFVGGNIRPSRKRRPNKKAQGSPALATADDVSVGGSDDYFEPDPREEDSLRFLADAFPNVSKEEHKTTLNKFDLDPSLAMDHLLRTSAEKMVLSSSLDGSFNLTDSGNFPRVTPGPNIQCMSITGTEWGGVPLYSVTPSAKRTEREKKQNSSIVGREYAGAFPSLGEKEVGKGEKKKTSNPSITVWDEGNCGYGVPQMSIASKLKIETLRREYPSLHDDLIEDVFRSQCESLEASRATLAQLTKPHQQRKGQQSLKANHSVGSVGPQVQKRAVQTTPKKKAKKKPPPLSEEQVALARRRMAELTEMRAFCFRGATAAYVRGDSYLAKKYSLQGKEYDNMIKECRSKVFGNVLNSNQHEIKLDLHGLPLVDALEIVERVTQESKQRARVTGNTVSLCIITGRGAHSHGGKAKIKPEVKNFLSENRFLFQEKSGLFLVEIRPHHRQ